MRSAIVLPDEIGRNQLIDIISAWKTELDKQAIQYKIKDLDYYCYWIAIHEQMILNLQPDKTSSSCFLMFNNDDVLEAIAFCQGPINKLNDKSKKYPFHIYDFLAAPWNVQERLFTSNDSLKNKIHNIEYKLIKSILIHCKERALDYAKILYEPNYRFYDIFYNLFITKFQFNQSYRELGRGSGMYINGFELSWEKLKNTDLHKKFSVCATGYKVKLFDNYSVNVSTPSEQIILDFKIKSPSNF